MSASLIGRLGSSAFRLSAAAVSMSLTGKRSGYYLDRYVAASRYGAMVPSRGAAVLLGLHRTNRTKSVRARELLPFMTPQARAGRP
jgi:hypothetical protein